MARTETVDADGNKVITYTGVDLGKLKDNLATAAFGTAQVVPGHCRKCKQPFSNENVFSTAGWRETQLSGMCEACWDAIFKEDE